MLAHLLWPCLPLQLHLCSLPSGTMDSLSVPPFFGSLPPQGKPFAELSLPRYSYASFRFQLKCHYLNSISIDPLLGVSCTLHFSFGTFMATYNLIFVFVTLCFLSIATGRGKAPKGREWVLQTTNTVLDSLLRKWKQKGVC